MERKVFIDRTVEHHHHVAVENLAKSLNHSTQDVSTLYSIVLKRYTRRARIKNFLSALVTKRVKELLKDTRLPSDIDGRRSRSGEF